MYNVKWNWTRDESIVDEFSLLEENVGTIEEALLAVEINIDIQEDGGERPLKYRIETVCGDLVRVIDATAMTKEERLQHVNAQTRAEGKKIFEAMLFRASNKTQ